MMNASQGGLLYVIVSADGCVFFPSSLYKLEKDIECLSETLNKLLKSRQTVKARIMASMVLTNHNLRDRPDY